MVIKYSVQMGSVIAIGFTLCRWDGIDSVMDPPLVDAMLGLNNYDIRKSISIFWY